MAVLFAPTARPARRRRMARTSPRYVAFERTRGRELPRYNVKLIQVPWIQIRAGMRIGNRQVVRNRMAQRLTDVRISGANEQEEVLL